MALLVALVTASGLLELSYLGRSLPLFVEVRLDWPAPEL
jgi:hypothetical protein